jgi:hypothetical protein
MTNAECFLYPRVCPVLALSHEDLVRSIETYGRTETFTSLANLITKHYDFPYARYGNTRMAAPSSLGLPRSDAKPKPAPVSMLLGGYRCTRLPSELKIPGITLIMQDNLSKIDWAFDGFVEQHRMKCWVAVQGKTRRWTDSSGRNDYRSPFSKATHPETLMKLLDAEVTDQPVFNHGELRQLLISQSEAVPPTVELYLQTIEKLKPTSMSAITITYGIAVAAMACTEIPCSYRSSALTSEVTAAIGKFVNKTKIHELGPEDPLIADLVFIDAIPYGTHDLRAFLGEETTPKYVSYPQHLKRITDPLRQLITELRPGRPPTRVALVISLREMPSLPSIEPLLLSILSDEHLAPHLQVVGALVSQKRDYGVYLILMHHAPRPQSGEWGQKLKQLYPELDAVESETVPAKVTAAITWDAICLRNVQAELITAAPDISGIALQGPRIVRGKETFPTRTRIRNIISETNDLDNGSIVYVFGDVKEPVAPVTTPAKVVVGIADPLLSRMVSGIRQSMAEGAV